MWYSVVYYVTCYIIGDVSKIRYATFFYSTDDVALHTIDNCLYSVESDYSVEFTAGTHLFGYASTVALITACNT